MFKVFWCSQDFSVSTMVNKRIVDKLPSLSDELEDVEILFKDCQTLSGGSATDQDSDCFILFQIANCDKKDEVHSMNHLRLFG